MDRPLLPLLLLLLRAGRSAEQNSVSMKDDFPGVWRMRDLWRRKGRSLKKTGCLHRGRLLCSTWCNSNVQAWEHSVAGSSATARWLQLVSQKDAQQRE